MLENLADVRVQWWTAFWDLICQCLTLVGSGGRGWGAEMVGSQTAMPKVPAHTLPTVYMSIVTFSQKRGKMFILFPLTSYRDCFLLHHFGLL